jgi:hypothetical protein
MDRQRLLDLLQPAEPQIGFDSDYDPGETAAAWLLTYPQFGLICDVPFATSFVYSLVLTGTGPAHSERQRLIDEEAPSNVVLFERKSLVTLVEPQPKPARMADCASRRRSRKRGSF